MFILTQLTLCNRQTNGFGQMLTGFYMDKGEKKQVQYRIDGCAPLVIDWGVQSRFAWITQITIHELRSITSYHDTIHELQ